MKKLNSKRMRRWLYKGMRAMKGLAPPSDGSLIPAAYGNEDGWHFQVEYVHDTRFRAKPWKVCYAWPQGYYGSTAKYCLACFHLKRRRT